METEHFSGEEFTLARPEFDPFQAYEDEMVKYVHLSKEQLLALAKKAGIELPDLNGDELIFWGPTAQKHSMILTSNFGIPFRLVESEGKFINAGSAISFPNEKQMILIGVSGDLRDEKGQSIFSSLRSREGVERKMADDRRTIDLLKKIYGDRYLEYSQHQNQL